MKGSGIGGVVGAWTRVMHSEFITLCREVRRSEADLCGGDYDNVITSDRESGGMYCSRFGRTGIKIWLLKMSGIYLLWEGII